MGVVRAAGLPAYAGKSWKWKGTICATTADGE